MGPLAFFLAMAILPLFWAPLSPFLIFAPAFGMGVAIAGTLAALTVNMTLAWLVSGSWFRPFFERLVKRFGYSVPRLAERDMMSVALMIRIMPGMPFPLQNYLLGLSGMPLGKYLLVSVPTAAVLSTSLVLFGEALLKGSGGLAFAALLLFAVVTLLVRFLRGHHRARRLKEEAGEAV